MALSKVHTPTRCWTSKLLIRKNVSCTFSSVATSGILLPLNSGQVTEYKSADPQTAAAIGKRSYPIFDGTRFKNPWSTWKEPDFRAASKFMAKRQINATTPIQLPKEFFDQNLPIAKPTFLSSYDPKSTDLELTWVGHATCLLMMDGVMILTDPVFSDYCAPIPSRYLRRLRPVPFTIDQLPSNGVLMVVISHNHYDHLDYKAVRAIHDKFANRVTFFVPKGLADWFRSNVKGLRKDGVVEMSWWQSASYQLSSSKGSSSGTFQIVNLPAQHWSQRHLFNRNKSLWSGWAVVGPSGRRFYFTGDTGYSDEAFKEIGNEVGPFDLAAIPIGAYEPRDFMSSQHCNPQEAVQIHKEVRSKKSVGIHWGTFYQSIEPVLAPRLELASAVETAGLDSRSFITVAHGETIVIRN